MNITVASAFPLSKESGASAKVSYEFQLDDPEKEIPLHAGWLAMGQFFPQELRNMSNLGDKLPVQVSRLGDPSEDWRRPRPVTESFNIAAFEPEKLLEILQPGEEALIGLAVQATVNGRAVDDDRPLEKNLLVHRGSYGSSLNTIKIAEVESLKDALRRPNIYNVIGRTAGVIHQDQEYPYSPSEYFGWPTNAGDRNRTTDGETYQVRHLGNDLFLGGELVLEPVVEAARGGAEVHENGTLVGYDLIAIGWQTVGWKREIRSQILQEFR